MRWDDRLGAVAHKAAPDAIHVECWAATTSLNGREAALPRRCGGANACEIARLVERQGGECGAVGWCELNNVVVEARHGDVTVLVVQRGNHGGKGVGRIHHGAAVAPGMEINVGGAYVHLNVGDAAEPNREGRTVAIKEAGVANDHGVAAAAVWVRRHPRLKVHRTRLLFALEDVLHVDGQGAAGRHERLEGAEMDHDLTLIVGGATSEHASVANDRLKRAGLPEIERVSRLHVVVAVDHHGR